MSQIKFNLGDFLIPPEITIRLVTRWHILVPKLVPVLLGRALVK